MRSPLPTGRRLMALLWSVAIAIGCMGPALADQQDFRLEGLFARLQTTSSRPEARAAQQQIWQIWIECDDSQADRLMQGGIQAMAAQQHGLALEYFDRLVERAPDFAEGWNKRATAYFLLGDFDKSLADCDEVMKRNPYHWGALSGYGMIHLQESRPAQALGYFEKAITVNPNLPQVQETIEMLKALLIQRRKDMI
jgi:tetratricopeptide (TPR) repeat protein